MVNVRLKRSGATRVRQPQTLKGMKGRYIKRLNDLHVGTQITVAALLAHREKLDMPKKSGSEFHHFVVPSGGTRPEARIRRDKKQMNGLLGRMANSEEYGKSLMLAVSITEDYLASILKLVMRAYPDRINRGIKNGEADTNIGLDELLTKSKEQILDERVQGRLVKILYGSPAEYLAYLKRVLQIDVDEALMLNFVETKATRDILVHANGIANSLYVDKAGERARATPGAQLPIDGRYFGSAIAAMKALILAIHNSTNAHYANDTLIAAQLNRFNA